MIVLQVVHEGDTYTLQCGNGMQRVAWVARIAAQRLGLGGIWCTADKEVGRPKEYVPGRVFYPDGDEIDAEATLASLVEAMPNGDDTDLTLVREHQVSFVAVDFLACCGTASDYRSRLQSCEKNLLIRCLHWLRKEVKTL